MQFIEDLFTSNAVHHLGWMLLHSLWLMLIPAGLLALAMLALPKRMSNTRYAVSTLSLFLMVGSLAAAALLVPERTTLSEETPETLAMQEETVADPLVQQPVVVPIPTGDAADLNNMLSAFDPAGQPVSDSAAADLLVADNALPIRPETLLAALDRDGDARLSKEEFDRALLAPVAGE